MTQEPTFSLTPRSSYFYFANGYQANMSQKWGVPPNTLSEYLTAEL